jgi:HK97 family phage major capsid protein
VTVARAQSGDREAAERVERAVAHQTTADNPGLIPRPILGPVVDLMDSNRPFIASVTNRPLPASGQFDRPIITQPVKVDIQNGEKTELASQKMLIGKLPVAPDTFGGYVNISRQDIKRTTPGIMQIIAESFGTQYALRTDQAAVEAFIASILAVPILVTDWTAAEIMGAIFEAAAVPLSAHHAVALPDTLWVSTDVWGQLGSIVSPNGNLIFPSLTPNSTTGNVMGLKLVVDAYFPAGSGYLGSSRLVEWYEDVDGLVQVADVPLLGTQVGYSGDGAFLNTSPESFSKLSFPPITAAASASKSK